MNPKSATSKSPKGRNSPAQGAATDEPSEAGAEPWVAAKRKGKSLKGRDKLCNSGHCEVGVGKGLSHPCRGCRKRVEKVERVKEVKEAR